MAHAPPIPLTVRAERRQPRRMTPPNARSIVRALEARGPARRSALYRWLYAHHVTMSRMLDDPNRSWVEAAELLAAQGLVGANGQPISPKALRQMWLRVTRDVERAREVKAAQPPRPKPHRSRPAGSFQPARIILPAAMPNSSDDWMSGSRLAPAPSTAGEQARAGDAGVEDPIARLQRTVAGRSGH